MKIKAPVIFFFAAVPAFIWLYFLLRRKFSSKWLLFFTFVGGMIAAKIILIYQGYWDQSINLIFFHLEPVNFRNEIENIFLDSPYKALFFSFIGVGVAEEYAKFWIMKLIGSNFYKSIDDVIGMAIASALGFAFFENVIYFMDKWSDLSAGQFFAFALMRVTVVTMVHMLCSGILGYYYGMAFFSSPMLKIQYMKKVTHPVLAFFTRSLHLKPSKVYYNQMYATGLIISIVIHGLYDFLMTIQVKGMQVILPVMLAYFFGGFWLLTYLLKKKEHQLKLGLVGTSVMPQEDFEKLLDQIHKIKEEMKADSGGNHNAAAISSVSNNP